MEPLALAEVEDELEVQKAAWWNSTLSSSFGQIMISDPKGLSCVYVTGAYGDEQVLIRDISSKGKTSTATSAPWVEAIKFGNPSLNTPTKNQHTVGRFVSRSGYPLPIYESLMQVPSSDQSCISRIFGWNGVMYLVTDSTNLEDLVLSGWVHAMDGSETSDTSVERVGGYRLITIHEAKSDQWLVIGMSPEDYVHTDSAPFSAKDSPEKSLPLSGKCYFAIGKRALPRNAEAMVCFSIGLDKAGTQTRVSQALADGWSGAYASATEYWTSFFNGLRERWLKVSPALRYKGYVALQQIAMATYNPDGKGSWMSAGPGTWYANFIRDTSFCIKSLSQVKPELASSMLDWFVAGPADDQPIDGRNCYGLDGREIGLQNNTDNAPTFLLAVGEYYETTRDLARMTSLKRQIESALIYCKECFDPKVGHLVARHPHDFGDDVGDVFPLNEIRYESMVDVLWTAALESIAPVFTALGDITSATYCLDTAKELRSHLADYRDSSGLLAHSIKPDGTRQTIGYYGASILYDAWLLNDEASWRCLSSSTNILGLQNSPINYLLALVNAIKGDKRQEGWAPFVGILALLAHQHGDESLVQLVKEAFPGGSWPEYFRFVNRAENSISPTLVEDIVEDLRLLGVTPQVSQRLMPAIEGSASRQGSTSAPRCLAEHYSHARSFPWAYASIVELVEGLSGR